MADLSSTAIGIVVQVLRATASGIEHQMLDEFVAEAEAFESYDPQFSLEHLLTEVSFGGAGFSPTEFMGNQVATRYRTKGLRWPNVYLVGLEAGYMSNQGANSAEKEREERRLCFVGLCGAEDSLTVTRAKYYDGGASRAPWTFRAKWCSD
jgi:superfamily I DNA/RNA helicase